MPFVIQHKTTGLYLTERPSTGMLQRSPNLKDAQRLVDFADAEKERRQLREFAGAWMSVPVRES